MITILCPFFVRSLTIMDTNGNIKNTLMKARRDENADTYYYNVEVLYRLFRIPVCKIIIWESNKYNIRFVSVNGLHIECKTITELILKINKHMSDIIKCDNFIDKPIVSLPLDSMTNNEQLEIDNEEDLLFVERENINLKCEMLDSLLVTELPISYTFFIFPFSININFFNFVKDYLISQYGTIESGTIQSICNNITNYFLIDPDKNKSNIIISDQPEYLQILLIFYLINMIKMFESSDFIIPKRFMGVTSFMFYLLQHMKFIYKENIEIDKSLIDMPNFEAKNKIEVNPEYEDVHVSRLD